MYDDVYRAAIESLGLIVDDFNQHFLVGSASGGSDRLFTYVTVSGFTTNKRDLFTFDTFQDSKRENSIENITNWARIKMICHEEAVTDHGLFYLRCIEECKLTGIYSPIEELNSLHARGWATYPIRYNGRYICFLTDAGQEILRRLNGATALSASYLISEATQRLVP